MFINIAQSSIESASWVCNTGWQKLYDFHQYYEHIEAVYRNTVLIKNIKQDAKCSGTLPVKEELEEQEINISESTTLFGEDLNLPLNVSIEEPELHIKTEISDDDMPLLERYKQEKSHRRTGGDPLNNYINPKCSQICEISLKNSANEKLSVNIKKEPGLRDNTDESIHLINETDSNCETEDLNLSMSCSQRFYSPKTNRHQHDTFIMQHFKITCVLCHIHVETFQTLRKHFEIEHKQLGYAVCCKKKFYRRSVLIDHINRHLDPNYFKCDLCGKILSDRRCLELHHRRHLEKPEKTHCCDICGKGFSTNSVLNKHKLIHLSEEEKHFPCSECGKK